MHVYAAHSYGYFSCSPMSGVTAGGVFTGVREYVGQIPSTAFLQIMNFLLFRNRKLKKKTQINCGSRGAKRAVLLYFDDCNSAVLTTRRVAAVGGHETLDDRTGRVYFSQRDECDVTYVHTYTATPIIIIPLYV